MLEVSSLPSLLSVCVDQVWKLSSAVAVCEGQLTTPWTQLEDFQKVLAKVLLILEPRQDRVWKEVECSRCSRTGDAESLLACL